MKVSTAFYAGMALWSMLFVQPLRSQSARSGQAPAIAAPPAGVASPTLPQTNQTAAPPAAQPREAVSGDYRIGRDDLLDITVLEAAELNRAVRVSATGEISLPPLGNVQAAGLQPHELEQKLQDMLRQSIMQDPHVNVFVREIESHPVSVTGAVRKPGVFRIRGPKALLEIIAMAEGLAEDAGNTVLVTRGQPAAGAATTQAAAGAVPASAASVEVNVKDLLNSTDARFNVPIYPGDTVKVTSAGLVYVLGDVRRPGGFVLRNSEDISALQALAMAEGIAPTAAKGQARIIRTDESSGQRTELALDLGKVMSGKVADPMLRSKDILFIPRSGGKAAFFRSAEAIIGSVPGALIYRGF